MVWGSIAGYLFGKNGGGGGGDSRDRSYQKIGATGPSDIPLDDTFRPRYLPDGHIAQDVQFEVGRAVDRYNRQQRETGISVLANQGASEGVYSRGGAASLLSGTAANISNAYFRNQQEEPYVSYWGDRDAELRARKDAQKAGYLGLAGSLASAAIGAAAGGGFSPSVNVQQQQPGQAATPPQTAAAGQQAPEAQAPLTAPVAQANMAPSGSAVEGTQAQLAAPPSGSATLGSRGGALGGSVAGGGAPGRESSGGAGPSSSGGGGPSGGGGGGFIGPQPRGGSGGPGGPGSPGFIGPPTLQAAVASMDPRLFSVDHLQVTLDTLDQLLKEALQGALAR